MRHCSPSLAEQLPCRRQAGTCISQQAGSAHSFCSPVSLCCRGSCWGCIPVPSDVPLKPQCPCHPGECGPILLCPPGLSSGQGSRAHVGRDGSGCWGWKGCTAQEQFCSPRGGFGWSHRVSQPAGPVPSSVCPAAALLVLSPWSHLAVMFPLSPLVIIWFEFCISPQFLYF